MTVPASAVASLGISVASSVLGRRGAQKDRRLERQRRLRAARLEQEDLVIQSGEVRKQAAQARFGLAREVGKARGAAANSAANAGVGGLGVTLLDRDIEFQGGLAGSILDANERSTQAQIKRQYDSAPARALAGMSSNVPSSAATALQIIGSFTSFFEKYGR